LEWMLPLRDMFRVLLEYSNIILLPYRLVGFRSKVATFGCYKALCYTEGITLETTTKTLIERNLCVPYQHIVLSCPELHLPLKISKMIRPYVIFVVL
jgi:hypothetical protein